MSFLWHGLTDQGAQVPVQVDDQGRVVAVDGSPGVSNWERTGTTLSPATQGDDVVLKDGAGTATVQLNNDGSATFAGDVQMASQNSGPLAGFRNQIINGDFRIRQYFNNTTGSNKYITDRWCTNDSTTGASPDVTEVRGASKGLRLDGGSRVIRQAVELPGDGFAGQFYNGSQWTMSIYSTVAPAQLDVRFCDDASFAGSSVSITGVPAWTATNDVQGPYTRYTCTFNVNAAPGSTNKAFRVSWLFPSAATFTLAQLEPGPVATPYEHRPIGTELALCQRYYQTVDFVVMSYTSSSSSGNQRLNGQWHYATTMRVRPSITIGNNVNVTGATVGDRTTTSARFNADSVGSGNSDIRGITADAEL